MNRLAKLLALVWLMAALSLVGWLFVNLDTAGWILVSLTVGLMTGVRVVSRLLARVPVPGTGTKRMTKRYATQRSPRRCCIPADVPVPGTGTQL